MRIGAVNYLNSKPLVYDLAALAPNASVVYDLPSRLADSLSAGRLDVALVPSVEFFRAPGYRIVSDACVACRGPVLSVKVLFRVPPKDVRRLALDEGSRTSAELSRILLAETFGVRPELEPLPVGCGPETTDADAVLLIGDRAIAKGEVGRGKGEGKAPSPCPLPEGEGVKAANFVEVWDLGERWTDWTRLPFVFAMWIAREGVEINVLAQALRAARDHGLQNLDAIAEREAPLVGVSAELGKKYFRENLHFVLGQRERAGLRRFYELCVKHGIAPSGKEAVLEDFGEAEACRLWVWPDGRR